MSEDRDLLAGREIIFEFSQRGDYIRVAAIDVDTGIEVYAMGPLNALQTDLEKIAAGKLVRRLQQADPTFHSNTKPRRKGRGLLA